jgi:hypothetical protein
LDQVFPGLKNHTVLHTVLAPIDGFLGATQAADDANLAATEIEYRNLINDFKQLDPSFADEELLPSEGIAGLDWKGRNNLTIGLRVRLAAEYYRLSGDIEPLQLETLRYLQNDVDVAYDDAVVLFNTGKLKQYLSEEEAIGNYIDPKVRDDLKRTFSYYKIPFGPRSAITINNRDYISPTEYRVPDARIGDVSFDWTLTEKTMRTPQISDYFRTQSQVRAVFVIRPKQLGPNNTYLIPRSTNSPLQRRLMMPIETYVPQDIHELIDLLRSMMLSAPRFIDKTGYLPFVNLSYVFQELHEGLSHNRKELGEERYWELMRMSAQMRALFNADPEDKTGDTTKGRQIIHEMEGVLMQALRSS